MSTSTPTPEEIKAEYASSLADLTFNSRPLINVLTMLAEENSSNAKVIVEAIETHLQKVSTDVKLPILYLIDCIVKNVGGTYTQLFSQNIVSTFCNVFKAVDEKTRAEMFKLRQTWNDVFPQMKLYAIDVQISLLDPAWPVTAKAPSNSIHFNPKFLKSNQPQAKTKDEAPPILSTNPPSAIDKETLLMQEKLIQKQKELLELQQKKLELEVLQTKVKLQEQIKSGVLPVRPQNILLKPEVAKQLVPDLSKHKPAGIGAATMLQHQRPPMAVPNSNGSRIHPASSALIAAAVARPIRDPRLLRQQHQQQPHQQNSPQQVQSEQTAPQKTGGVGGNRGPGEKHRGRKSRRDPRIATKEDKAKEDKAITKEQKSPTKLSPIPKTSSPKRDSPVPRNSPIPRNSPVSRSSPVPRSADSFTSGSTSSLDSPTKMKREEKKTSPTGRQKKKDRSPKERPPKVPLVPPEAPIISGGPAEAAKPSTTFPTTKGLSRNRNYMKNYLRMRGHLNSPERQQRGQSPTTARPQDEDLRFAPPEKQPRLQQPLSPIQPSVQPSLQPPIQASLQPTPLQSPSQQKEDEKKSVVGPSQVVIPPSASKGGMDVDLRQLPAVITKKRPSIESLDQPTTKRSKSETLDKLFGDEDTDLRQLPVADRPLLADRPLVADRPPTPPPPIISNNSVESSKEKPQSPVKSNLDAIRAKLANATNRDKVMSKSYNKKKANLEDIDLRVPKDIPPKIIITPEDEHCIKSGNMTKEQEAQLLTKIIVQMEKNKLKEARKKDHEETFNVSLQPISDDELIDSDDEDMSKRKAMVEPPPPQIKEDLPKEEGLMPFNDKDERIGMGHFVPMQNEYQPQFFPRDATGGFPRRFPGPWRGRGRGRHWDNQPPQLGPRGGPRPWNAWRNLSPQSQPRDFVPLPQPIPMEEEMPGSPEMSSGDQLTNGAVNQDEIKTLNIDGVPKDIRFYDETAVVFINWDDPREITFQEEGVRHVTFNDKETYALGFDRPYVEVQVNGKPHMVRIGAPSRELFIDHVPYECYFGSAGIRIDLDGVPTTVKLEGPPPQVKIGEQRRTDLVAGKISMFVDAVIMVPVFLDAKPQRFIINGETSTLRFVNALETVLINDTPFKVEYGGLPKPIMINGKKRFIRFSVLPRGVKAGRVSLKDMEGCGSASPQRAFEEEEQNAEAGGASAPYDPAQPVTTAGRDSPERNSNSPGLFHNFLQQQSLSNLDALTNAIVPSFGPSPSSEGYQVENHQQGAPVGGIQPAQAPAKPGNAPLVNINELFQKLVASGFVTSSVAAAAAAKAAATPQIVAPSVPMGKEPSPARTDSPVVPVSAASGTLPQLQEPQDKHQNQQPLPPRKKTICETLRPVLLNRPETLKIRQAALYSALYSGMQCSSCGMRFSPEATMLYSQHLDWHFRQNRRGKKNARVASSRKWYYSLADWKNYEELEDLEEREKNYFDQQQQAEGAADEADEDVEVPSVPADPDSTDECCEVCRDKFDQFFNEEKEEWHLRNAIRIDDKTYHPVCYDDYLQSLNDVTLDESTKTEPPPPEEDKENIPGLEIVNLDDDDDEEEEEEEASSKPEVVSVESDESKNASAEADESQPPPEPEEDDDDVILNEVAPIKIVVDDDEDDDFVPTSNDDEGVIKIKEEKLDDGFVEVSGLVSLQNGGQIKIKAEPVDLDDIQEVPGDTSGISEAVELEESSNPAPAHQELLPSIDGNVEVASLSTSTGSNLGGKIKINISKPLPQPQDKDHVVTESDFPSETYLDPFEPFPPGEEPEPVSVKPALKGLKLHKLAPVRRGEELTGLCSIM